MSSTIPQMINLDLAYAESSMRGFLLTDREAYLQPYTVNIGEILPNLLELKDLIK